MLGNRQIVLPAKEIETNIGPNNGELQPRLREITTVLWKLKKMDHHYQLKSAVSLHLEEETFPKALCIVLIST